MNLQTVNFITDLGKLVLIMIVICSPFILAGAYISFKNFMKEMIDYAKNNDKEE